MDFVERSKEVMSQNTEVLVIGVGSIGERHVRCFQRTGRVRLSICELNAKLAAEVAARYDIESVHHDLNAAMKQSFDAAVICTPAHLHVPMAIELSRAGTHMLIEKPLSTCLDRVAELREIVERQKLVAAVAYVYRVHPVLTAMRQTIREGRFGKPVQIVAQSGQHFPTYRPAYREIYYTDRATGGGAIQDALTHVMNAGEWLVGPIERLAADAAHQVLNGVNVEDTVHVLARHGEVMACYTLNQHQAPNESAMTVVCEGGTTRFEGHNNRWRWMNEPGGQWHDEPRPPLERDDLFVLQANAFLDAIDTIVPPPCTLDEGLQTLRVNLAVLESAAAHSWVEVKQ